MTTRLQRLRAEVISKRGRLCAYCGSGPLHKRALHLNHVQPLELGGEDDAANLRPACSSCHAKKGASPLTDYVVKRLVEVNRERDTLVCIGTKIGVIRPV